jgi:hypothetical protein
MLVLCSKICLELNQLVGIIFLSGTVISFHAGMKKQDKSILHWLQALVLV